MTSEEVALWRKRFEDLLEYAKLRFAPLIVLWGPGPRDEEGFQKRNKIRDSILLETPKASVILPEDPEVSALTKEFVSNLNSQEMFQGLAADLIFALDISQGVSEEVARYSAIHKIASRLIIVAHDSRKNGYSSIVREKLQIRFFSDDDLQDCNKASQYCREQVRAWLIEKIAKWEF